MSEYQQAREAIEAARGLDYQEFRELERTEQEGGTRIVVHRGAAESIRSKGLVSITVLGEGLWRAALTPKGAVALAWIKEHGEIEKRLDAIEQQLSRIPVPEVSLLTVSDVNLSQLQRGAL